MFKYKKYFLYLWNIVFIILSIIELIKYLLLDSEIFGLIYLLINLFILFLLIPLTYNYKRNYSKNRISKMILIILIGIFNCYFLDKVVIGSINYVDNSSIYIDKIYVIKNILKAILYFTFIIFTLIESRVLKKIIKKG